MYVWMWIIYICRKHIHGMRESCVEEGNKKMIMNMILSVFNIHGGWGILVAVLLLLNILFLLQHRNRFFFFFFAPSSSSSTSSLISDSINSNLRYTLPPSFYSYRYYFCGCVFFFFFSFSYLCSSLHTSDYLLYVLNPS